MPLAWIPADPTPWSILAAISRGRAGAEPASAAAAANTTKPPMYTLLRVVMSASRPIGISMAVVLST